MCEGRADIVGPALDSGMFAVFLDDSVYTPESASNESGLSTASSSGFSMISASVGELMAGVGKGGDREILREETWLSLILCTPKLFSSVRKKVIPPVLPAPPAVPFPCPPLVLLNRKPGDGDRDVMDDFGRAEGEDEDEKTSSRGRIYSAYE